MQTCQDIKIDASYLSETPLPKSPVDLNKDGKIDDGEILDMVRIILHENYWVEVEKKHALINDIKKQVRSCQLKVDALEKELLNEQ